MINDMLILLLDWVFFHVFFGGGVHLYIFFEEMSIQFFLLIFTF